MNRYSGDVLKQGWRNEGRPTSRDVPLEKGLVVEDPSSGFVGAVIGWENGIVVLEDRRGTKRSFPVGPGFWIEGKPVALRIPLRQGTNKVTYTASGSRADVTPAQPKVALPSRIYVEGRHDAELVEKVWGDDLRHVGVVVEFMGGIDDLPAIVHEFAPAPGRRLGVLVDHLVPGSKESRIAAEVAKAGYRDLVMVTGHDYIDVWHAVKPAVIGLKKWPEVPRDVDFKKGTLAALKQPHDDQKDIATFWRALLGRVKSYRDLDGRFVTEVEKLIDFVTADHV
ncbi:DUF3097 domain-containing protein [Propionibacteriaceae bacterium G1746]|uniref:DUF3097 domain-containing protein n=1 Tax=Aestuariimicrobium sp. G57 TaxID=3418485 RepID=UPI003C1FD1FF